MRNIPQLGPVTRDVTHTLPNREKRRQLTSDRPQSGRRRNAIYLRKTKSDPVTGPEFKRCTEEEATHYFIPTKSGIRSV